MKLTLKLFSVILLCAICYAPCAKAQSGYTVLSDVQVGGLQPSQYVIGESGVAITATAIDTIWGSTASPGKLQIGGMGSVELEVLASDTTADSILVDNYDTYTGVYSVIFNDSLNNRAPTAHKGIRKAFLKAGSTNLILGLHDQIRVRIKHRYYGVGLSTKETVIVRFRTF